MLLGQKHCVVFGGTRAEKLGVGAVIEAAGPLAIEASIVAQVVISKAAEEPRGVLQLDLQHVRQEVCHEEEPFASRASENLLIALELEKLWEEALG
ncbi:MAG: hypothetical protein AAGA32_16125 [Pseudomonadota bacterium]